MNSTINNEVKPVAKGNQPKLPYSAPVLGKLGKLNLKTQSVGNMGNSDGGGAGMRRTA